MSEAIFQSWFPLATHYQTAIQTKEREGRKTLIFISFAVAAMSMSCLKSVVGAANEYWVKCVSNFPNILT